MRRSLIYLSAILGLAAVHSCAMDDIVYPDGYGDGYGNSETEAAGAYLSLEELKDNPVEVSSLAGTYVLKVVSHDKWSLTSSEAWCTPDIKNGFKYSQVSLAFVDNPWNTGRTAKMQFTLEETGDSFVLNVTQKAADTSLSVNYDKLEFGLPGGETSIVLSSNAVEWNYTVTGENGTVDWISNDLGEGVTSGKGTKKISIKAKGNTTGAQRNATIVFTANDKTVKVPVSQSGEFESPVVELLDEKEFALNWKNIVGVDGYDLEIATDEKFQNILQTESVAAGTESFNLENITWAGGYVGKVWLRVIAKMTVEGTVQTETSNVVSAHNYFDETSGDGSEENPYKISCPRHLNNVRNFLNAHYVQTSDINLSGIDFEPISSSVDETGSYIGDFDGVYDADGKTISNLSINRSSNMYCGLFARLGQKGAVRNLTVVNPQVRGKVKVGTIAGETLGIIEDCLVKAGDGSFIEGTGELANFAYLGGISGQQLDGRISRCTNDGVKVFGVSGALGGIVGKVHAVITTIVPNEYTTPVIEYCFNSGEVTSDTKTPLGGIAGDVSGGNPAEGPIERCVIIRHCHNSGSVHGKQANNQVGGIVGRTTFEAQIFSCSNSGDISAQGGAGGIVGRMGGNLKYKEISNCLNTGTILSMGTAANTNNVSAGIVASGPADPVLPHISIKNCLNLGECKVSHASRYYNGICENILKNQNVKFDVSGCYALDTDSTCQDSHSDQYILDPSGYTNISEAQMKEQSTFAGWDFIEIWQLTNGKYPTLRSASK
ncbi:MAG: BACON domain-containing protein [Candidatus Cryptobacteroides sp.]